MENQIEYLEDFMTRVVAPANQPAIDGKTAYDNLWILPLQILVLAASKYPIFEKIEKTMQEGRIVWQREASVSMYPVEWQRTPELRNVRTVLGGTTLDYYSLELSNGKVKILESADKPYDASTEKNRPRIRMSYFPKKLFDAKEHQCAGFVLTYELPILRRKVMLPRHQGLFQEADKKELFDDYRDIARAVLGDFFKFAQFPDYPEVKFLDKLTEFLEFDIDFLEADGSRAEWWDTFLRNLRMGKFVKLYRDETLAKRNLKLNDTLSFIDFFARQAFYVRQDFEERKKSR